MADTPAWRVELRRWFRIGCRSLHLLAIAVLVGGHFFAAPADSLRPWLYVVIASGAGLMSTDVTHSLAYLAEVRGFFILVKIVAVSSVALFWDHRVAILFAVVLLSGVVSHMSGRYRYFRIIGRPDPKEPEPEKRTDGSG